MIKYSLPLFLAAALACGPKGEYQAPANQTPVQNIQKTYEQQMGEEMLKIAESIARTGNCTIPLPEVTDCQGSVMDKENERIFTRAIYHKNFLALEAVSLKSGQMVEVKTPSGEIRPAKIEATYTSFARINPPELLYGRLEQKLTLYTKNNKTGDLEIFAIDGMVKCFDTQKREYAPDEYGLCPLPAKELKTRSTVLL